MRRVRFGERLRALSFSGGRVAALDFGDESVQLALGDRVILAVPPMVAASVVPDLQTPDRVPRHRERAFPPRSAGRAAADDRHAEFDHRVAVLPIRAGCRPRPAAPTGCSSSRARSLRRSSGARWRRSPDLLDATCRPGRSCASGARLLRRRRRRTPGGRGAETAFGNLYLAGDWTETGLPATIEGAIRSGNRAAELALRN